MKIALVILHADPARGGAERYTTDLAHALATRTHEIHLLASTFPPNPTLSPTLKHVPLSAHGPTRLSRYLDFLRSLESHLAVASPRYDVVHAMLPVRRCDVYHPHAGLAVDAVQTGHLKHATPLGRAMAKLANRFNRKRQRFAAVEWELLTHSRPPVVLCLSDYVKHTVRKHYPLSPRQLAKLFNGVDLQRFDPTSRPNAGAELRQRLNISPDKLVALMIAQDYRRKGLSEAIAALARVADPRLVLLVAGKEDPASYRREAARLGVADRVIFAGPTDDPPAFYQAADFFVLPTRHDPCSLVVLESLAMGLPVISTRFNGACEIMTPNQHGLVLPNPADIDALAAAMRQLLAPDTRQSMRQSCLDLRPTLSQEAHVDRLLSIYDGLR